MNITELLTFSAKHNASDLHISAGEPPIMRVGEKGLALGKRGRSSGDNRKLSQNQEAKLQRIICDKSPQQMKLPFALWTSAVIQDLVWDLWHIRIARRTISTYLRRWAFTPQKPAKRAYEQCSKAVQKWLDEDYPLIKERAKGVGAEIYWGDETGVRNQCHGLFFLRPLHKKIVCHQARQKVHKEGVYME